MGAFAAWFAALWVAAASLTPFHTFTAASVKGAAFTRNGSHLYAVSLTPSTLSVWLGATSGQITAQRTLNLPSPQCGYCLAIHPDNPDVVAVCCTAAPPRVFHLNGTQLQVMNGSGATALEFNPRNPRELVALTANAVLVFDSATGAVLRSLAAPSPLSGSALAVSPHECSVAAVSASGVYVWDHSVSAGAPQITVNVSNPADVAFNPSPQRATELLFALQNRTWATTSLRAPGVWTQTGQFGTATPATVAFHPAGTEFVCGGSNNVITDWVLATGATSTSSVTGAVSQVRYNPGTSNLVVYVNGGLTLMRTAGSTQPGAAVPQQACPPSSALPPAPSAAPAAAPASTAVPVPLVIGVAAGTVVIAGVAIAAWKLKLCAKLGLCGAQAAYKRGKEQEREGELRAVQDRLGALEGEPDGSGDIASDVEEEEFDGLESIEATDAAPDPESAGSLSQ